ncbi:KipI antagonist [Gemmata obscuriglobus]|uniref:Urea amidolyase n=1 Tax=Gemmata obscuriglobus TaxID=114 RepID=A0A2Z3HHK2_9BACT|nr:biotin-dependent carboxyltransferase family protein [Gemmata obscuriglobus]AWM41284.1 urea amidolyase [Gemmata obscuriglobus]QEG25368.1 KipI antagonist [Gemmata obscuriglobus]VTR98366.1 urea amidolyase related protein : Urea amidolyase related protein OS=Alicyclobacillus acidocaldarius (strain Tc-4-1) GN=kipA PE=4 SV=1: AHS2 [Gemmata obscuriglobus UQM 2246]
MSLSVREPGLQSLLVDFGRERSRALGVPVGGAADRAALALGNALVGNASHVAALEVALAGPVLEALHPTACVIFGAPFQSTVNGRPLNSGMTFQLDPGEVLRVGGTAAGARAYLCVAGGFEANEVLGSRSALEPIRAGTILTCAASRCEPRGLPFAWLEEAYLSPPFSAGEGFQSLRTLDGPQRDWFVDDRFFTQTYDVLPASNRMGVRFHGAPIVRRSGELVSEAVAPGAVQVTNDGLPIVLGADGQTIGGYPKVAHVIRADLDRLAQLRPGDRVRFVCVSSAEAENAARERAEFLRGWLVRLAVAERRPVLG